MTAQEAYLLARAYTNKVAEGGGAAKGAACQIKSITAITGGHRITFEWEDNAGNVETDTMDVMDGADGAAGVGISKITYKDEDAKGNYIYTITLTSGSTYDITCPRGPQGATGATGADGADGNGIASITKTGTSGLVDTYTITYTNGTTSTFTVTNGADLTAGQYIEIDNDTISVKRDIARDVDAIITTSFDFPNCTVTKTIDEEVVDTVTFSMFGDIPSSVMDVYSVSYNGQAVVLTFTNTVASKEQSVGYTFQVASYSSGVVDTQTFVETLDADKKLIIQSELDAALADKVDKVTGKGLSENDFTDAYKAKVDASLNVFTGTQEEWEALSATEKKNYQRADFTDDYDPTAIGDLTALHTSAKSSIVNAINEVKDGLTNLEPQVVTGYTAGSYCNSIGASTTVVRMGKLIVANINLEMVSGAIPNGGTLIDGLPIPKNRAYASAVSGNNMARVLCFNETLTVDGGTTGGGWWNILLVYVVN